MVPATNAVRGYAHELREAIGGKQRAQRARADAERATTSTKEAERRLQAAQARSDALRESAGIGEEAELDSIIAAVAAAAASRRREAEALRELTEVGEGQSLTTLEAEAEALPPDEAAALRDSLATRRREIESEREAIGRSLAEAEAALERSASEAASAEAQQGVTETQSALAATSQRYVELAAGAAFLRWLIDRHRKTTQAPLLARAGDLIATVTHGAYTRLLIEHDDDRARIIAERADGDHIGVEGLSEGTRDQLYLALRLAALGVRGGPSTLPLICDDLLVTADDRRAAAMLAVLQAASETMQVLVFTHHGHLVEVARRAVGDDALRLHALEPVRFAAAAE